MVNKPTPDKIKARVMKERGITAFKSEPTKHRRLRPVPQPTIDPKAKTPMMRYLELVHGEPIESMLLSGSQHRSLSFNLLKNWWWYFG